MKTSSRFASFRFALALGLIAPASFVACAGEVSQEEGLEEESYESSIESAPEFNDADDSVTRPTMAGELEAGSSASYGFARGRKFIGYSVRAAIGETMRFEITPPIHTLGTSLPAARLSGYRLALYRQGRNGNPTGRALAVGSSNDNGGYVTLEHTAAHEAFVIVAYRLKNGSVTGAFRLSYDVEAAHQTCGGWLARECPSNQFCHYEASAQCGAGDQTGTCEAIPEICPLGGNAVCGCDGQTYLGECAASAAGTSILHYGACEEDPEPTWCGGLIGRQCGEGQVCVYEMEAQCGAGDQTGTCQEIPEICPTASFGAFCGCDGVTYNSSCDAKQAGTSVLHVGACAPQPRACGARLGNTCGADEYCRFEEAAICGHADATGVCETKPTICTREFNPVCGCDGNTYSNACGANAAGTSVLSRGACAPIAH